LSGRNPPSRERSRTLLPFLSISLSNPSHHSLARDLLIPASHPRAPFASFFSFFSLSAASLLFFSSFLSSQAQFPDTRPSWDRELLTRSVQRCAQRTDSYASFSRARLLSSLSSFPLSPRVFVLLHPGVLRLSSFSPRRRALFVHTRSLAQERMISWLELVSPARLQSPRRESY
jgi:hypothetical protein